MLLSCRNHYCDVTSSLWRRARSHVTCLANERSALTRSTYTQWRHGQAEQKLGTATETQTTGDVSRSNQEREACGRPNARPIYDVTISCNMGISSPTCVYWRHVQVTGRAEPLYMRIHNVSVSGRVTTMYIVEGGGEWRRGVEEGGLCVSELWYRGPTNNWGRGTCPPDLRLCRHVSRSTIQYTTY